MSQPSSPQNKKPSATQPSSSSSNTSQKNSGPNTSGQGNQGAKIGTGRPSINPVQNAAQASAKTASAAASTASKVTQSAYTTAEAARKQAQSTAYNAAESTRKAAQNVVSIGGNAVRDALSSGMRDMRDTQDRVHEMSREGVENLARSADVATRVLTELVSMARGNVDAYIECGNVTASAVKNISAELVESCNKAFSDYVDISKEAFNCRTINDVMDLNNRVFRQVIDRFFSDSSRLCNMAFESCTEAMEPINERMADASDQLCKALAA
ncbi:MAG: phasin family protein [Alphaproteobacteria bacterium]|nr:phasin family protein [Alphaproteobacteria bacterium]